MIINWSLCQRNMKNVLCMSKEHFRLEIEKYLFYPDLKRKVFNNLITITLTSPLECIINYMHFLVLFERVLRIMSLTVYFNLRPFFSYFYFFFYRFNFLNYILFIFFFYLLLFKKHAT